LFWSEGRGRGEGLDCGSAGYGFARRALVNFENRAKVAGGNVVYSRKSGPMADATDIVGVPHAGDRHNTRGAFGKSAASSPP
jgi:hypothetical protein